MDTESFLPLISTLFRVRVLLCWEAGSLCLVVLPTRLTNASCLARRVLLCFVLLCFALSCFFATGTLGARITGSHHACLAFTWLLEIHTLVFVLSRLNHLHRPLSAPFN